MKSLFLILLSFSMISCEPETVLEVEELESEGIVSTGNCSEDNDSLNPNNSCNQIQICEPNQTLKVSCDTGRLSVAEAYITQVCNADGTALILESQCEVEVCADGFYLFGNACLTQVCSPGVTDQLNCTNEIPNSLVANRARTCNGSGSAIEQIAQCSLTQCMDGFVQIGNTCVDMTCNANEVTQISCTADIADSAVANRAQTCNANGTGVLSLGDCILQQCSAGHVQVGNTCVDMVCNANEVTTMSCTEQITNSLQANITRTCNGLGTDYAQISACTLEQCQSGYSQNGNVCVLNPVDPPRDSAGNSTISSLHPNDTGIANHPSVIYYDGFESGQTGPWQLDGAELITVLNDQSEANSGNFSMRHSVSRAQVGNADRVIKAGFELPTPVREGEVYWRFYARFEQGTVRPHHWVRMAGGPDNYFSDGQAGMIPPNNGFFFDLDMTDQDNFMFYTYWQSMRSWQCLDGSANPNCEGRIGGAGASYYGNNFTAPNQPSFNKNEWFCIEMKTKLNDMGQNNGELEFFINDQVAGTFTQGTPGTFVRDTFHTQGSFFQQGDTFEGFNFKVASDVGIQRVVLDTYYSSSRFENTGAADQQTIYYDDVVIATERIGCKTFSNATPVEEGNGSGSLGTGDSDTGTGTGTGSQTGADTGSSNENPNIIALNEDYSHRAPLASDLYLDATTGVDTNPGTSALPKRNVTRALLRSLQPGQTLWLRSGTYPITEDMHNLPSGTAENRITVAALPGHDPLLYFEGVGAVMGGTYLGENQHSGGEYWDWRDLRVSVFDTGFALGNTISQTPPAPAYHWRFINLIAEKRNLNATDNAGIIFIDGNASDYIEIIGGTYRGLGTPVSGSNNSGLWFDYTKHLKIIGARLDNFIMPIYFKHWREPAGGAADVEILIKNNIISNATRAGVMFSGGRYVRLENNLFYRAPFNFGDFGGGESGGSDNVIIHNTFIDSVMAMYQEIAGTSLRNFYRNNIFTGASPAENVYMGNGLYQSNDLLTNSDFNAFSNLGPSAYGRNNQRYNLAQYQAAFGQEMNSVQGNILFMGGASPSLDNPSEWTLANTSAGKNASSSGTDMGVNTSLLLTTD